VKQCGRPSATVVSKPTLTNNHGTSTSSSSSAVTMPLLFREVEVPYSAPLLLRPVTTEPQENSGILVLTSSTKNDLTLLNSTGAREAPKLLTHEISLPPPIILQSRRSSEQKSTTPPEGSVRRRVEEIETSWGANHKQPPSMYTSITVPLEVWVVQEPNSYAYPTIFYKTPQILSCDYVIGLPLLDRHVEQAVNTIRADPRLAHLLEKSGIKLQRNYRLPSPPAICKEWWDEAERLIKRKSKKGKNKTQPKFGLRYVHDDSTTSEDEGVNDPRRVMRCMTSVTSNQPEEYATFGEECDNPYLTSYQPRSFYVVVNAHEGMRDEQYLLSRVIEALNVGE
jgi:hypothetical protein